MRTYVRTRVKGGTYFFTVNLAERHGNTLLVDRIDALQDAFRRTRKDHPFSMPAYVVMPEHLHCLWKLPPCDDDFPLRWRLIKSRFSRAVAKDERRSQSRLRNNERGIWQRRYWEQLVRDDAHLRRCLDYIHYNPIKHGHALRAADWAHSSFRYWVDKGRYPLAWATAPASGFRSERKADPILPAWNGVSDFSYKTFSATPTDNPRIALPHSTCPPIDGRHHRPGIAGSSTTWNA